MDRHSPPPASDRACARARSSPRHVTETLARRHRATPVQEHRLCEPDRFERSYQTRKARYADLSLRLSPRLSQNDPIDEHLLLFRQPFHRLPQMVPAVSTSVLHLKLSQWRLDKRGNGRAHGLMSLHGKPLDFSE